MKKPLIFLFVFICLCPGAAFSHVPYIETQDFSDSTPFSVKDSIENSKAIYAWLENGNDVDVYVFKVTSPVQVFAQVLVPECPGYEDFLPWFAVVGPGLPQAPDDLPFTVPDGYGAMVIENLAPGETRTTFFEEIAGKFYYDGPTFEQEVFAVGTWYVYYWDPNQQGGDYVAVLGFQERFSIQDLLFAIINTPLIWFNGELHTACPQARP